MRVMSHDHVHHSHTAPAAPTAMLLPEKSCGDCCGVPSPAAAAVPVVSAGLRYRVTAMDCASEESEIRRALEGVAGIRGLGFRLGERSLRIDAADDVAHTAVAAIRRIGYEIQPWPESGPVTTAANGAVAPEDLTHARGTGLARLLAALALATGAELLSFLAPDTLAFKLIGLAVAGAAIGLAGFDVFKKGLTALLHGRLNINALMSVAVTGAFVIGQWPEAAMVMALYAIAELIEARAVDRARNAIGGLLALAPEAAAVRQARWQLGNGARWFGSARRHRAGPPRRAPGDGWCRRRRRLCHRPGAGHRREHPGRQGGRRPGLRRHHQRDRHFVESGSPPRHPIPRWHASSMPSNRHRAAARPRSASSTVSQRSTRRRSSCWRSRWPCWAAGCSAWPWLTALYKALVLLVIACPCALVISTPVTVVSGLAAAARRGILIKGGVLPGRGAQAQGHRARQDRHHHRRQAQSRRLVRAEPGHRPREGRTHCRSAGRPLRPSGLQGHRCRLDARTASRPGTSTPWPDAASRPTSTARSTCSATIA